MSEVYQISLFEPGMTETVEVTEIYGLEPGGIFSLFGKDSKPMTIKTCWGDLCMICNALEDYANILEKVIIQWDLNGYHAAAYELHAARCRKVSRKYANAIGYDYQQAIEKCRKQREKTASRSDIGEDALVLLSTYGVGAKKKKEEQEKGKDEKQETLAELDGANR